MPEQQIVSTVVVFALMIVLLYFMMIRPDNKRKKETQKMISELAVGDQITTVGGIKGTVCAVKEDTVVIETGADRVRIEFTKSAVGSKEQPTSTK